MSFHIYSGQGVPHQVTPGAAQGPAYGNSYMQDELPPGHPLRQMGELFAASAMASAGTNLSINEMEKVRKSLQAAQPAGFACNDMASGFSLPSAADLRELKRRGQLREAYSAKLDEALSSLPSELKGKISDMVIKGINQWMLGHGAFSTLQQLKREQADRERRLHEEREALSTQLQEERKALLEGISVGSEAEIDVAAFDAICQEKLLEFDKKAIRTLDQVVAQTQATLHAAGAPGFTVTTDPDDIRIQMAVLQAMADILGVK